MDYMLVLNVCIIRNERLGKIYAYLSCSLELEGQFPFSLYSYNPILVTSLPSQQLNTRQKFSLNFDRTSHASILRLLCFFQTVLS